MSLFLGFEGSKQNFSIDGDVIVIDGERFFRVPFSEEDRYEGESLCHDCGETVGSFHSVAKDIEDLPTEMIFCDGEECPKCHMQLMSCACLENPNDGKMFEDDDGDSLFV